MSEPVLFEIIGEAPRQIAVATLNAPKKLNALDLDMIQPLTRQLLAWQEKKDIALVVLRGAGERAFCAGGDIRIVAEALHGHADKEMAFAERYFPAEYTLDYLIHEYRKPLLIWGNGVVMGGGMGLMNGGMFRVVTETSMLAMPEITIGLFPDVGAAWFYNRLPHRLGVYLGVTGARLNGTEAVHLGLADYLLPSDGWDGLIESLQVHLRQDRPVSEAVATALQSLETTADQPNRIAELLPTLKRITSHLDTREFRQAILDSAAQHPWLTENAERVETGAPTAFAVIVEQFRRTRHMSLADVFRLDLDMAIQYCRRHDFPEGVRALLVDKDNQPRWQPASMDEVSTDWVNAHLASPWSRDDHPLRHLGEAKARNMAL